MKAVIAISSDIELFYHWLCHAKLRHPHDGHFFLRISYAIHLMHVFVENLEIPSGEKLGNSVRDSHY